MFRTRLHALPMKWKITVLSFGIIVFSVLIGEILFIGTLSRIYDKELGQQLLTTARTVAEVPDVIHALSSEGSDSVARAGQSGSGPGAGPQSNPSFNQTVNDIRVQDNVDYIVVMDMHHRILTDPLPSKIGTISKSQDEAQAFVEHTYLSRARGSLGQAIRAFVPVMNKQNNLQVGVVLVGKVLPSLGSVIAANQAQILLTFLLSSFFGVLASFFLAGHIKRQMLDMEPSEISKLLLEHTATFYAMHEGIISVDSDDRITIFNDKSRSILGLQGADLIGKRIDEIGLDERLVQILKSPKDAYNQELYIGTGTILYTRMAIPVEDRVAGAILIFQDRTEVTKLAEELTGVRAFVDALRVQNHEFLNKLHTIGGLVQLDNKEKVLEYIWEVTEQREELTRFLSSRIRSDEIAGLLLAKINRGRELGVDVMVDRDSRLTRLPSTLDEHDWVVILGNLIENAFDALADRSGPAQSDGPDPPNKQVFIKFQEQDDKLWLLVEDNGCGMDETLQERIFQKGVTTKTGPAHGYGMHLVKAVVEKGNGRMDVDSAPGKGTRFTMTFPMKEDGYGG